jgi:hypothetical protein
MVKQLDCLMCGRPLPPRHWWQSPYLLGRPPWHDPDGPDADACWSGLCVRIGLPPDVPRPRQSF